MARFREIRVRDMRGAAELLPPKVWALVLERCGDMVVATPRTERNAGGSLQVGFAINADTIAAVRAVLEECLDDDAPWRADAITGPWTRPGDWWKTE